MNTQFKRKLNSLKSRGQYNLNNQEHGDSYFPEQDRAEQLPKEEQRAIVSYMSFLNNRCCTKKPTITRVF